MHFTAQEVRGAPHKLKSRHSQDCITSPKARCAAAPGQVGVDKEPRAHACTPEWRHLGEPVHGDGHSVSSTQASSVTCSVLRGSLCGIHSSWSQWPQGSSSLLAKVLVATLRKQTGLRECAASRAEPDGE